MIVTDTDDAPVVQGVKRTAVRQSGTYVSSSQVYAMHHRDDETKDSVSVRARSPTAEEDGAGSLFKTSNVSKADAKLEVARMRERLKQQETGWVMLPSSKRMRRWDCATLAALLFTAVGVYRRSYSRHLLRFPWRLT